MQSVYSAVYSTVCKWFHLRTLNVQTDYWGCKINLGILNAIM